MSSDTRSVRGPARFLALLGLYTTLAGCVGATLGSGVGDRYLARPPYYAGQTVARSPEAIGHLPITYQRGGSHSEIFDPRSGEGSAVAALVAEMNAYLDGLGATERVTAERLPGTAPDVHFGCETEIGGECRKDVQTDRRGRPLMRLAVGRPSGTWVGAAQQALDATGVGRTLVITLEVGQYWPRQRNWRGDKEIEIGTGHAVGVPWLTALDAPVTVLQLTGALVDRDGRAVRIGAEGLLARRTNLLLTSVGVQALISDEDVQTLRTRRREDLPGGPLVWQEALRTLVAELTGQRELLGR
jgi:hypothetical protein